MFLPFERGLNLNSSDIWAFALVILFFAIYFVFAIKIYPRSRFKFIKPHKNKKESTEKINVPCDVFYAMYQKGGFKSPEKAHFTIHAFKSEKSRNLFINTINSSHRKLYNENNTYAVVVTNSDIYVEQALDDVKNNPIIYNNLDYINQRIYVEHKEH